MKKNKKIVLLSIFIIMLLMLLSYFGIALYYFNGFGINTWINGIYCTGKSVEEVNMELLSNMEAPVIMIIDKEGGEYSLDLSKCDYVCTYEASLKKYIQNYNKDGQNAKEQNPFLWIDNISKQTKYNITPEIQYDQEKLMDEWLSLPMVSNELDKKKEYGIFLGDEGYQLYDGYTDALDCDKAFQVLQDRIRESQTVVSLPLENCYYSKELSNKEKEFTRFWNIIDEFQKQSITYDMGAEKLLLSSRELSELLEKQDGIPKLDQEGKLLIDSGGVEAFITKLCEQYDTYQKERSFQSTRGDTIQVPGVTYGTQIDKNSEITYLEELLNAIVLEPEEYTNKSITHTPKYKREGFTRGINDIGGTYIEIDMTEQKMYYYQDYELQIETEIVTGNTRRKMGTPEGVNYVYNKQRNRTLKGPGYSSFVKYWMPINGGIGIHDANWRKEFGGEIYKTNGSHGCINTPSDVMSQLYDMVEIGTPVISFY